MPNNKVERRDDSMAAYYRAGLPKGQGDESSTPLKPAISLDQILLWKQAGILDSHPTGRRIDGTEGYVVPTEDA